MIGSPPRASDRRPDVVHRHRIRRSGGAAAQLTGGLGQLQAGNDRVARNASTGLFLLHRHTELAGAQKPSAMILSCTDSRLPPELVFNAGLGAVRSSGGVEDPFDPGHYRARGGSQVINDTLLTSPLVRRMVDAGDLEVVGA